MGGHAAIVKDWIGAVDRHLEDIALGRVSVWGGEGSHGELASPLEVPLTGPEENPLLTDPTLHGESKEPCTTLWDVP